MNEPAAQPVDAPAAEPTFDVLALGPEVRRAIDAMGYKHPTPVQRAVYEPAAEGRSLVVQARTGTGKTAAFGLPIVDRLVRPSAKQVQALVLCPTRELALQVSREVEQIGQFKGIHVAAIYGGASMTRQIEALDAGAQLVVGTPGRVLDHLRQKTLNPSGIRILVLDEADEMLSMGFAKELNSILEMLPTNRQGLFFSATLPPDIERLARKHLRETELITLSSDQVGALEVDHYVYVMQAVDKVGQLVRIIEVEDPESAIVFCNTRDETQRVAEALKARGFDADWLNGDLPQSDRERVMSATRGGRLRFLVATDVAARGIDISHLTHVINYDFPETAEQYVHRTGRTGRAGRTGTAIALVGPKDIGNLYLLRLTYKIRPIEKQLPSAGEVKTRAEMDLLQLFVDAFGGRVPHPDDLSLARRLLTHPDAERIVAGLLRDHLGARGGDAQTEAAEARRARNPPAQQPAREEPKPAAEKRRPEGAGAGRDGARQRAAEPRTGGRAERPQRGSPVASYASWEPPEEADDERPILASDDDTTSPLPRYTVEGEATPPVRADRPARERSPRRDDRATGEREARERTEGESRDRLETPPGFVQLFVNVGKREGVHASDLQKLLTDKGIDSEEAGRIRVRDRMSFITVKKDAFDRAVGALTGQVVGGRTVVAELARGRS
ncbi:MAG TPA: DEAD/DEAH box helicase [Polyangiaceae bacterium]|jgi:ATP-dependent RNA helicase DeaD